MLTTDVLLHILQMSVYYAHFTTHTLQHTLQMLSNALKAIPPDLFTSDGFTTDTRCLFTTHTLQHTIYCTHLVAVDDRDVIGQPLSALRNLILGFQGTSGNVL